MSHYFVLLPDVIQVMQTFIKCFSASKGTLLSNISVQCIRVRFRKISKSSLSRVQSISYTSFCMNINFVFRHKCQKVTYILLKYSNVFFLFWFSWVFKSHRHCYDHMATFQLSLVEKVLMCNSGTNGYLIRAPDVA